MKKLKEIEVRTNAATPGPWFAGLGEGEAGLSIVDTGREIEGVIDGRIEVGTYDATFIAAARTDLPFCLDWMQRAVPMLKELQYFVDKEGRQISQLEALLKELE